MAEVTLAPLDLPGMVALKGDLADRRLVDALRAVTGGVVPGRLGAALGADGRGAFWMAPDELLVLVPDAAAAVEQMSLALVDVPHLVADMSDARLAFRLSGPGARAALARLVPVDLSPPGFGPGVVRRTRLAQVACAIWMADEGSIDVMVFRSVAAYARGLLQGAVASETVAPLS